MQVRYALVVSAVALFCAQQTQAGDSKGEAIFEEQCAECHRASNYSGGNPNKLAELIGKIVAGHTEHEIKITLDHEQVAAVARYMAGS